MKNKYIFYQNIKENIWVRSKLSIEANSETEATEILKNNFKDTAVDPNNDLGIQILDYQTLYETTEKDLTSAPELLDKDLEIIPTSKTNNTLLDKIENFIRIQNIYENDLERRRNIFLEDLKQEILDSYLPEELLFPGDYNIKNIVIEDDKVKIHYSNITETYSIPIEYIEDRQLYLIKYKIKSAKKNLEYYRKSLLDNKENYSKITKKIDELKECINQLEELKSFAENIKKI